MSRAKTLRVRVRDKHAKQLSRMARSVNFVWNYVNALSERAIRERNWFFTAYDIHTYIAGTSRELGLHSQTVQRIAFEYVTRRDQYGKARLAWRKSYGARRNLGWVPINSGAARWKDGHVYYNGQYFKVWDSYNLNHYKFRSASFNEDARGRWYFSVVVTVKSAKRKQPENSIAIDLNSKQEVICSDGQKFVSNRFYPNLEAKLAIAQRANNKRRVQTILSKIDRCRKDAAHKFSSRLVNQYDAIYIAKGRSDKLAKTNLAKPVETTDWDQLKAMLEYKCDHAGKVFKIIGKRHTSPSLFDLWQFAKFEATRQS